MRSKGYGVSGTGWWPNRQVYGVINANPQASGIASREVAQGKGAGTGVNAYPTAITPPGRRGGPWRAPEYQTGEPKGGTLQGQWPGAVAARSL